MLIDALKQKEEIIQELQAKLKELIAQPKTV